VTGGGSQPGLEAPAIIAIIPAICLVGTMKQTSQFLPVTEAKNRLLHLIREIDEKDEVMAETMIMADKPIG